MYVIIRSGMSSIMELIRPELRVVCPWIRKIAIFNFVYTLASANIDQSVPNLATICMPIRSRMSLIMGQIELEHPELFALEFGKIAEYDCLHSSIYKYWPVSTKLGQNVCDHKITDEFDYEFNPTRTLWVICPWICKNCWIWLCLYPSIYNCRPNKYQPWLQYIWQWHLGWVGLWIKSACNIWSYLPWIRKLVYFVYTLASTNNNQHQTW